MEAIITAATVATMFFNLVNSSEPNGFCYNVAMDQDHITMVNDFDVSENILEHKLQYEYAYDDQDRLVKKTAKIYKAGKWETSYVLDFSYDIAGYSVTRRRWDAKHNSLAQADELMTYETLANGMMAVDTYKWDEKNNDFARVDGFLMMNPGSDVLYALLK